MTLIYSLILFCYNGIRIHFKRGVVKVAQGGVEIKSWKDHASSLSRIVIIGNDRGIMKKLYDDCEAMKNNGLSRTIFNSGLEEYGRILRIFTAKNEADTVLSKLLEWNEGNLDGLIVSIAD